MTGFRLMILALTAMCPAVHAGTTIFVDDDACPGPGVGTEIDPYCSIQFAIDNAVDTDEIIAAEGTYLESIDLDGKAITLRSSDPLDPAVVAATVIDGNGALHVVLCNSGEGPDTVLDGLTITGGVASGTGADNRGGGMFLSNTSPTITRCVFTQNIAVDFGGGLYSAGGSPTITDCTFNLNTAFAFGGGIAQLTGSLTVSGCTFTGNTASAKTLLGGDANGGGIYLVNGDGTVADSAFTSNFAGDFGGGIRITAGIDVSVSVSECTFDTNGANVGGGLAISGPVNATVSGCTFTMNDAVSAGGGMRNSVGVNGTLAMTDCMFAMNTAGSSGAGLNNSFNPDGSTTVSDCTFTGNSSPNGAGMDNDSSSPTVTHCTFTGNTAFVGGGMSNNKTSGPTVINCLFVGNEAGFLSATTGDFGHGGGMVNAPGSTTTVTNCTFKDNTSLFDGGGIFNADTGPTVTNCILWGNLPNQVFHNAGEPDVTYSNVQGGFAGAGNIDDDPLYADAGGRLSAGSPAIDAGNNAAPDLAGITADLDGNDRFVDDPNTADCQQAPGTCGDPPVVDMGAYEHPGGSPCPWDCEAGGPDGNVGINDFLDLLIQWQQVGVSCDIGLGAPGAGIEEFLELLLNWGPCP